MNQTRLIVAAVALVAVLFAAINAFFTVAQDKQALVLQFGAPVRVVKDPGLQFKLPFVQNVLYFEKRLLDFDDTPREIVLGDQNRVVVDVFARYRIVDPLAFFTTARNEFGMRQRLANAVQSNLQNTFGGVPLQALLTDRRSDLMRQITAGVVGETRNFGIEVVDVRIMRADLPPDNSNAIYARMQTEREREARQARAEGVLRLLAQPRGVSPGHRRHQRHDRAVAGQRVLPLFPRTRRQRAGPRPTLKTPATADRKTGPSGPVFFEFWSRDFGAGSIDVFEHALKRFVCGCPVFAIFPPIYRGSTDARLIGHTWPVQMFSGSSDP